MSTVQATHPEAQCAGCMRKQGDEHDTGCKYDRGPDAFACGATQAEAQQDAIFQLGAKELELRALHAELEANVRALHAELEANVRALWAYRVRERQSFRIWGRNLSDLARLARGYFDNAKHDVALDPSLDPDAAQPTYDAEAQATLDDSKAQALRALPQHICDVIVLSPKDDPLWVAMRGALIGLGYAVAGSRVSKPAT